mgnify:CR=1 FL=1|jgi:hypothetical protein|tara:strand:+ start:2571 stop:2903 length:333 start_codon:yes stop_codon:yes gene_type:complete
MDVDIEIYINKLKTFFKNDKKAKEELFGTKLLNEEEFFKRVRARAIINFKEDGEPTLSQPQMAEVIQNLLLEGLVDKGVIEEEQLIQSINPEPKNSLFQKIKGFPPICLN